MDSRIGMRMLLWYRVLVPTANCLLDDALGVVLGLSERLSLQ